MSREKTWYDQRLEWEARMRKEAFEAQRIGNLAVVEKHVYRPQPWDNVDLGERCEWSDLHKSTCAHCKGVEDDGFSDPNERGAFA